ncbi:putative hc protease EUO, partial [Chlamydia psittaci 84-8471/1]
KQPGGKSI